ncbi:hypothetical protein RQP54_10660 [Curvibacter sp. APW13]|uniref:hypothetical protein n=1 Tax=Curvibacter sp. APW13 TaxID=3077236 RepID=UPI0028DDF777|nr:hypothetical protein [Curvibacter sp. APW13]MDT8991321.1 hypothetical protein [Curvibacter sp. APW13]
MAITLFHAPRSTGQWAWIHAVRWLCIAVNCAFVVAMAGCSPAAPRPTPQTGQKAVSAKKDVVPPGVFETTSNQAPSDRVDVVDANSATLKRRAQPTASLLDDADAWIYSSAASQAQLMRLGIDPSSGTRLWSNLLRAKGLLVGRISQADEIDRINHFGLIVLPQAIVLSEAEKSALRRWRQRGGSLLTTWEVATYAENGARVGDRFMQQDLGIHPARRSVIPDTNNYLTPRTDFSVLQSLDTGTRIWLEKSPKQPYLPLRGGKTLAKLTDWTRSVASDGEESALIQVLETRVSKTVSARIASLGYAEQSWQRMNPDHFNALHGDIVDWLMRKPRAALAYWPGLHTAAILPALRQDATSTAQSADWINRFSRNGFPLSVYQREGQGEPTMPASAEPLIANPWLEQARMLDASESANPQASWPRALRERLADGPVVVKPGYLRGFGGPSLMRGEIANPGTATDHILVAMEAGEAALPYMLTPQRPTVVVLPLTLASMDHRIRQANPARGFDSYLADITRSLEWGGLTTVSISSQDAVSPAQKDRLLSHIRGGQSGAWVANAGQIAQWWTARAGVRLELREQGKAWHLHVNSANHWEHSAGIAVWVSMPAAHVSVDVTSTAGAAAPAVIRVDEQRSVLLFDRLPQGRSIWQLAFRDAAAQ